MTATDELLQEMGRLLVEIGDSNGMDTSRLEALLEIAYRDGEAEFLAETAKTCGSCSCCQDVPCGGCQQGSICDRMPCSREREESEIEELGVCEDCGLNVCECIGGEGNG